MGSSSSSSSTVCRSCGRTLRSLSAVCTKPAASAHDRLSRQHALSRDARLRILTAGSRHFGKFLRRAIADVDVRLHQRQFRNDFRHDAATKSSSQISVSCAVRIRINPQFDRLEPLAEVDQAEILSFHFYESLNRDDHPASGIWTACFRRARLQQHAQDRQRAGEHPRRTESKRESRRRRDRTF